MSQQGRLRDQNLETLTGNTGGPVGPDASGNINVVGASPYTVTGNPTTNTLTIDDNGSVPLTFTEDSGTATAILNNINVFGNATQGSVTSGAGSTITITNSDASETQKGVSELATNAEAVAGTDSIRTIVPSSLRAKLGTQTQYGISYGNTTSGAVQWTGAGTNGQLIIAATGAAPAFASLTSTDGSVIFTPGANSLDLSASGSGYPITPYVVGPVGEADYQTIQDACDAANAAGGGIVGVQPGIYTENLTLYNSVYITGLVLGYAAGPVIIDGMHTPPATGAFIFNNVQLISATHIFNSNAAGTADLSVTNSEITITNGYTFNLPNWTGVLRSLNTTCFSSIADGFINNTGGSTVIIVDSNVGINTTNTMIVSGFFQISNSQIGCLSEFQNGSLAFFNLSKINQTITFSDTAVGSINNCYITAGLNPAIVQDSASLLTICSTTIDSGNNPAISGAGAGTISLTGVDFTNNSQIGGALTVGGGNSYSATYKSDYTNHGVLLGQGLVEDIVATAAGTNGQVLIGATGADPAFATLTSSGGTITFTPGVNSLNLEAADATTTQKGVLETSTNAESIAGASTIVAVTPASLAAKLGTQTSNGLAYGGGTSAAVNWLSTATNGQLPIGNTGNPPTLATLTAGTGITITNGAGSITIASNNSGMDWTEVTGTSQAMAVDNGYIANNAGLVTLTLPASAAIGDIIQVDGKGAGGWSIAQNGGQTIRFLSQSTTTGVGGSLASTTQYDCVTLRCITANTDFIVESVVGNLTVT